MDIKQRSIINKFQFVKLNKIEFEEAVRERKEMAEKDCTAVGQSKKSNPQRERSKEQ